MTTVSLLTGARALFTDEAHWYRGTSTPVPDDSEPMHCPITAITSVLDDDPHDSRTEQRRAAIRCLLEEVPFRLKHDPETHDAKTELIVWNDERATFEEVTALFDRAIIRAEMSPQP